jgi:hypothetical protein
MVRLLVRSLSLLVRLRSMVRLLVPLSPVLPYRLSVLGLAVLGLGLALSGPVVLLPTVLAPAVLGWLRQYWCWWFLVHRFLHTLFLKARESTASSSESYAPTK